LVACAATAACLSAAVLAAHDPIRADPALKRHAGKVTALGEPDAQGRIYSFRAQRLPAAPAHAANELRGWRLTMLAGKRFAHVFEVQGNMNDEITVVPLDGPLNGIAVNDVFVIENIAVERAAGKQ
jgi:hypothetical protein